MIVVACLDGCVPCKGKTLWFEVMPGRQSRCSREVPSVAWQESPGIPVPVRRIRLLARLPIVEAHMRIGVQPG